MPYFEVRYFREGLTTKGYFIPVMDGGFVSEECTREELDAKVAEIVGWHDGINSRISTPRIRQITPEERDAIMQSDLCFWSRQLSKMTYRAAERFRQG